LAVDGGSNNKDILNRTLSSSTTK